MRRWVGALAVVASALLFLLPRAGEAPSQASASGGDDETSAGVPPRVRVEHELVRVTEEQREVRPSVASRRTRARRTDVAPTVARKRTEPIVSRARRLLVGDGRYRPEPFPRPEPRESTRQPR